MGFSVVSKMVSFIWLPLMISRPWISRKNVLFLIAALIPLILFIMELPSVQIYQNGLKLYFQKFEFNSFLFGPLFKITGWHHWFVLQSRISFLLMLLFCIIYFILFVKHSIRNEGGFTFRTAWLILFAYLILSTTIHPWYITPLIMLSVFSLRYTGVVWSILIIISYQRYDPYWSAYEWTGWAIEYSLLLVVFAMEYFRGNKLSAEDNFAIRTNA
jgi:hypothetical protein